MDSFFKFKFKLSLKTCEKNPLKMKQEIRHSLDDLRSDLVDVSDSLNSTIDGLRLVQIDTEKLRAYVVSEVESLLLDLKASIWEMTVRISNVFRHSDFRYYHSISKYLKNNRQNVESVSTFGLSILHTPRSQSKYLRNDRQDVESVSTFGLSILLLDLKVSI